MSFNAFDIAEQQYKSSLQPEPPSSAQQPEMTTGTTSAFNPFDVAENLYQNKTEEDWWDATKRNVARTGSRMVETVLGLPGDIANFAKGLAANIPGSAGIAGMRTEQAIGNDAWKRLFQGDPRFSGGLIPNVGQQEIQQMSEALTGGYTAAQGPWEEKSDEVTKTLTNLLTASGGRQVVQGASRLTPFQQSMASAGRKLGMSVAAESAKEGIKLYGGTPSQQEAGKLASLMILGLTLPRLTGETNPENLKFIVLFS